MDLDMGGDGVKLGRTTYLMIIVNYLTIGKVGSIAQIRLLIFCY